VPQVCRDGHAIGRMAAEHFLECGLRNFAFRGDRPWEAHLLRAEGFMERVREAGFTCAYSVLPSRLRKEWSWKREISDLARFIRGLPLPAGVMAVEAIIGRHILQTCRILRLRVPEDLAVVGGVDDELTCLSCRPQLSSVALGADRVGWEAAALLDRILGGAAPPKKPIFIPPIRLMVRQSSDVLAIETPRLREAVRFIRAHACEGLVVKEVLARLSVSRRWLEQQFRKRLHRTPREEIRRVQAGRAKQLLAGTNHSMSAIAAACGYPNAMRFSANFRRAAGLSPTAYRRMSSRSFGASPKR
jgi:LacI family transcriptional regulator